MGKKGQETYQKIVLAAIRSFAMFGDKGTTFQSIADLAGVSQPLVSKHFKSRDAVLPAAIDQFLLETRQLTTKAMAEVTLPTEKIKTYIQISIQMFRKHPDLFKIYLLLHYYAGFDSKYQEINTEIKKVAVDRITVIIQDGIKKGDFKDTNARLMAKVIHSNIVGLILSITTERTEFTDSQLQKTLEEMSLKILKP